MFRNLKSLVVTVLALAAFGALGAAGAQGAEFHCSVEPCRYTLKPDGTGKTAHQSISVKRSAEMYTITCNEITGEATASTKAASELTFTNIKYVSCVGSGEAVTVLMNGCDYLLKASGPVTIKCPPEKEIEILEPGTFCITKIPAQGPLNKATYHDAGTKKEEITMSLEPKGISGTVNSECTNMKGGPFSEGEFTTANSIITAETDNGEAKMASAWWE
jgi:hypothetical protein